LDDGYEVFKTIHAVGDGLTGDMHEFHITPEGTALITVYHAIPYDLSPMGGPTKGWLTDSIFQEIDIETGDLIFEWRASEHVATTDTWRVWTGGKDGTDYNHAVDFFHINSVDKDAEGNYVVSGRHMSAVYKISGRDGHVIWQLGGHHSSFTDLSESGRATNFQWQHHARLHTDANGTHLLSLFDNGKSDQTALVPYNERSRGVLMALDEIAMTVTLVQEYADPDTRILSDAQGSVQMFADGTGRGDKALVAYGSDAAFAEFDAVSGDMLCAVRLTPWISWERGWASSYRTFKTTPARPWIGRPRYLPSVYLKPSEKTVYVSWNGATEVAQWLLQGAGWDEYKAGEWTDLDVEEREDFETMFELENDGPEYLRLVALDREGNVIGNSDVISRSLGNATTDTLATLLIVGGVCLGILVAVLLMFRRTVVCRTTSAVAVVKVWVSERWPWHAEDARRMGTGQWRGWKAIPSIDEELRPLYTD
jgi:hypothetical protein